MTKIEKNYDQLFHMTCFILAVVCFCLSILLKSCAMACAGGGIIFIVCSRRTHIITKFGAICVLLLISYMVYIKAVSFVFLPQAYTLLETNTDVVYWLKVGHIHAIRLAIVYPAFLLHIVFDIELNLAFGYYCSAIFALMYVFVSRILDYYVTAKKIHTELVMMVCIIALSVVMNGRICFAFLGFSILIFEMAGLYREEKPDEFWMIRYARIFIGLILSTVSSGTMMVCVLFTLLAFVLRVIKQKKIQPAAVRLGIICIIGSPVIYIGVNYIIKMIEKNITYFGGGISGIVNMLQHGLGSIFGNPSGTLVIVLIMFGIIVFLINIVALICLYKWKPELIVLVVGVNIAFYGLFVGFSTGTMILIPGIILGAVLINKLGDLEEEIYDG